MGRKVRLLADRFGQDNMPENSDDDPKKRVPEENAGTWGKHRGSTERHTAHERALHNFGTRLI